LLLHRKNFFIITDNYEVCSIGANDSGQLGYSTTQTQADYFELITTLNDKYISEITTSTTSNHIFATSTELGEVYCWGRNDYGQLGFGNTNAGIVPTPFTFFGNKPVKFCVSADISFAVTAKGELYGWGFNDRIVGFGHDNDQYKPLRLKRFLHKRVIKIVSGSIYHMVLIAS